MPGFNAGRGRGSDPTSTVGGPVGTSLRSRGSALIETTAVGMIGSERARIRCYSFGGIVGGAASNSAFSLALSCSTAARTSTIA